MAPSAAGCGSSNIAASVTAAAITTSSSKPAACAYSRGWSRPSTARHFKREVLATESPELNALLGGGVERGSSMLILGPAGTGKSLLALTFVAGAIKRGEKAAMFVFDEELGLLFERAKGLGIDLQAMVDGGKLMIEQVDAAELTPGELSARVRHCVEEQHARTVVIDSLNGYQAAMPEEQALILHMHELLQYLNRQGASTFLTVAQHGLVGDMKAPVDVTYLADTVILLRYFEAFGRVRRAISVIKKRTGAHEDTIREYRIDSRGITLGEPLMGFQGVLRGVPELVEQRPEPAGSRRRVKPRPFRTGADPRAPRARRGRGARNACRGRNAGRRRRAMFRSWSRGSTPAPASPSSPKRRSAEPISMPLSDWLDAAAGMVRLSLRPAHPARRRTGAQSRGRRASSSCSATSPSSSGRSTRRPSSASPNRRCAAAAANMKRAPGCEELNQLAADLEQRVEQRTAEHAMAVAQLHEAQKLETLGPAHRRRGARFQQSADPDHRRARPAAA